jgi:copper chaperone CopZ
MARTTLHAADISCGHCAMTIQRELRDLSGVTVHAVDVDNKNVEIEYTDEEALARAKALLEEIGYPVS